MAVAARRVQSMCRCECALCDSFWMSGKEAVRERLPGRQHFYSLQERLYRLSMQGGEVRRGEKVAHKVGAFRGAVCHPEFPAVAAVIGGEEHAFSDSGQ